MSYAFAYEDWPSRKGQGWIGGTDPGHTPWEQADFHVDLGCGNIPKARIGIDRFAAPGVAIIADLGGPDGATTYSAVQQPGLDAVDPRATGYQARTMRGLPFSDGAVKSMISHHCLEHIGDGFVQLIEEVHRVLEPGGFLLAITPLFPSTAAVMDPDHCRYFMAHERSDGSTFSTWDTFVSDDEGNKSASDFSVPYNNCTFEKVYETFTGPPHPSQVFGPDDHRELRTVLRKRG